MTGELRIEPLSEDNFEDFIYLIKRLAEYERLTPPDEVAIGRLKNDGFAKNPKYEAYVGISGSRPVAYLIYFFTYSSFLALPTLYIEDIFVLKNHEDNYRLLIHSLSLSPLRVNRAVIGDPHLN